MDELEIRIVLRYKVPERGLTFNGLLRGLEPDRDVIVRGVIQTVLAAIEAKAIERWHERAPERYVRHGRQPRARKFRTSFGDVSYRLAQMYDCRRGIVYCPLVRRLAIVPYQQYQGEALEAAVGQVIHLSYRRGTAEARRLRRHGPSKSTVYRTVQMLAQSLGHWPSFKSRHFRFLMVDGTKVRRQGPRGRPKDKAEMRWALASVTTNRPFEPVGFWIDQDWASIRQDLEARLRYGRLEVLLSDGGPGIEENLLQDGMRHQRCVWHGKRDFPFLLYQDGFKSQVQRPLRELLEGNPLFSVKRSDLETLEPADKARVVRLVRKIKRGFRELIGILNPAKYPMTRTYLENFYAHALVFFDYWLEGRGWIPQTTNAIETAFSRVVNRIKRVGRRWSEQGLLNWLMIMMRKIFNPPLWDQLWRQYLRINKHLRLVTMKVEYVWL
jgi:transposase-like protein